MSVPLPNELHQPHGQPHPIGIPPVATQHPLHGHHHLAEVASTWLRRPILGRHADRDLPTHLERHLSGIASMLHDVRLPGCPNTLDHLVVAPSGIWLIDVVHLHGRITKRDVGTWAEPELRFLLDGHDRTSLVDELHILHRARHAIQAMKFGVAVQTAMCVVDATWAMSARPFQVHNHWVSWPRALTEKIRSSGLVPISTARSISVQIAATHDRVISSAPCEEAVVSAEAIASYAWTGTDFDRRIRSR